MTTGRYWLRLAAVYAITLVSGLLCVLLAVFAALVHEQLMFVMILLPFVAAPIVFAVALARSPWLRHSMPLRVLMVIAGTVVLSLVYGLMYGGYAQGVALYSRHLRQYVQGVFGSAP